MARITVEDCVNIVSNRFELCLIASNRAKSILSGSVTTLDKSLDKKEKPPVIALREIAEGLIDIEVIRKNIVRNIKNRGVGEYLQSSDFATTQEMIEEEVASQSVMLKDTIFVEDNLRVDD
jgi:DNA-directed RNA polymerase subunit omega